MKGTLFNFLPCESSSFTTFNYNLFHFQTPNHKILSSSITKSWFAFPWNVSESSLQSYCFHHHWSSSSGFSHGRLVSSSLCSRSFSTLPSDLPSQRHYFLWQPLPKIFFSPLLFTAFCNKAKLGLSSQNFQPTHRNFPAHTYFLLLPEINFCSSRSLFLVYTSSSLLLNF